MNLAIAKGKQITTIDFQFGSIGPRGNNGPLRTATISINKMARVLERNIRQVSPDFYESAFYRCKSVKTRTISFCTAASLEGVQVPSLVLTSHACAREYRGWARAVGDFVITA